MKKKKLLAMKMFILFTFTVLILTVSSELILYYSKRQEPITSDYDKQNSGVKISDQPDNYSTASPEGEADTVMNGEQDSIKNDSIDENHSSNDISQTKDTILVFGGDIYMSDSITRNYDTKGIQGVLSEDLLREIKQADIAMVNQEFAFSTRGTPMNDKQFTFRIDPKYVQMFQDMQIDIVTLANNHVLDFGQDALLDTFAALENGNLKYVGAGRNSTEAKKTEYFEVDDKTIAILGASRVIPVVSWNAGENTPGLLTTYDASLLVEEIMAANESSDYVIVYVHWGIEKNTYPEEYQRNLAKQYIDAGADLVVGSHPHVLQGIEYYNGKPIVYSLGNFIFYNTINQTALLKVSIGQDNDVKLELLPCKAANGQTFMQNDKEEVERFYREIEAISFDISFNKNGLINRD
ncbi:MAG: hypothetical protein K0R92_325 [Lachnospiraceae bacterium]|jgi:poly-gamma-glutamate synthesis protein (capsule biosynthesis protein)|nr:hypothetical protein [Lachnospiraceae bacterium]